MTSGEKPDWWRENEKIKAVFDLPPYEPPRFLNGTYTHELLPKLEASFDCEIRFVGVDPRYPEDWEVRVDGNPVFEISRRRDEFGNTVYLIEPESFAAQIEDYFE